jgi:hypothetical protein
MCPLPVAQHQSCVDVNQLSHPDTIRFPDLSRVCSFSSGISEQRITDPLRLKAVFSKQYIFKSAVITIVCLAPVGAEKEIA